MIWVLQSKHQVIFIQKFPYLMVPSFPQHMPFACAKLCAGDTSTLACKIMSVISDPEFPIK